MNPTDDDRSSIFRRPADDDLEPRGGEPNPEPEHTAPGPEHTAPVTQTPVPEREAASHRAASDHSDGANRQTVMMAGMGGAVLVLLAIIGFLLVRPDEEATATAPSSSPTATASPTAQPTETPGPTASPTPEPTPAGPPSELAVGGWATVKADELDVRSAAGSRESLNRLVRGAVVNVIEGPEMVRGESWYRIVSLGGATGWATSGSEAEPDLETVAPDPTLRECGQVRRAVFDVSSGSAVPQDPLRIGDFALPAAAFHNEALAAMELVRGMGEEACFTARLAADGLPELSTQLDVSACGHAQLEGSVYQLHPTDDESVPLRQQVMEATTLHPALLDGGPPDDRMSTNTRTIVRMMANDGSGGCIYGNVTQRGDAVDSSGSVNVQQCSIVHVYNPRNLKLSPASGGPQAWIKLDGSDFYRRRFLLEEPIVVGVESSAGDSGRWTYAWHNGPCD